jgi:predicted DNA-binding protein
VAQPKNDDQITFRLPTAEKKDLKDAAERRHRTHNWLAREIVMKWLTQERKRRVK